MFIYNELLIFSALVGIYIYMLYAVYGQSPSIIILYCWAWRILGACTGEKWKVHKILVGKSDEKKALRRPRHRQVDIKMDLKETGWE